MARVLRLDQSDTFYRMINLILSSGRPPRRRVGAVFLVLCSIMFCTRLFADSSQSAVQESASGAAVAKRVVDVNQRDDNLLKPEAWKGWHQGFGRQGDVFLCDNGSDSQVERGVFQNVTLNQKTPQPIVAVAWSKSDGVGGGRNSDYSLYLDLTYKDGSPLWGRVYAFQVGTHDWQKAQVVIFPDKPVQAVQFYMLLRRHSGRAWFRDPQLHVMEASLFDGVPIQSSRGLTEGFQVRDVAAGSDFVRIDRRALDLDLRCRQDACANATFYDVTLSAASGKDRAVTLLYVIPIGGDTCSWLHDPRSSVDVEAGREYLNADSFSAGATGRLSRYPLAAVEAKGQGVALGIDMACPAFFRAGYSAVTRELFIAYDIGLAPEKPSAHVRFCKFMFNPQWGFRAALDGYSRIFEESYRRRTTEQGLWMPFAKISDVNDWQDFGFAFKEGTNETGWDDRHGILTFRYTEPMTWWMSMPKDAPRTIEAALAQARDMSRRGNPEARALETSGFHDEAGLFSAQLLDTPWCNGAVWSINSMPAIKGGSTDFGNKWNASLRDGLYGPQRKADLDGEYIDSSEGYVTDELDFRREHFAASETPLTFSLDSRKPAIFRGLIAFEYARAVAGDVHRMNKLMMANSTPDRLCWLAPLLDVMGTETDWHSNGAWRPMPDDEMLYRRAMCKGKPFCFLMNTRFEAFTRELVEKYMKRCLAYGMFPGFFSHNASQGHYFTRSELYERDRDLFRKYVPLCKRVAEAGWEPITQARSTSEHVHVERFGERYLTVFNGRAVPCTAGVILDGECPDTSLELVKGQAIKWQNHRVELSLDGEDVAVIQIR